jgi:hypothetical protein
VQQFSSLDAIDTTSSEAFDERPLPVG